MTTNQQFDGMRIMSLALAVDGYNSLEWYWSQSERLGVVLAVRNRSTVNACYEYQAYVFDVRAVIQEREFETSLGVAQSLFTNYVESVRNS